MYLGRRRATRGATKVLRRCVRVCVWTRPGGWHAEGDICAEMQTLTDLGFGLLIVAAIRESHVMLPMKNTLFRILNIQKFLLLDMMKE